MPNLDQALVRQAPESNAKLLKLLRNGLRWPIPNGIEELPLLDFSPEELHLDPDKIARLTKIQQLPKLVDEQTFAAFVLSFKGGSLPQGAIRRLVARLVKKRRTSRTGPVGLWDMHDIIFFCVSEEGSPRLHIVSFREVNDKTVIKVISWSNNDTENKIELLANRELIDLIWGDLGITVDARNRAFSGGYRQEIRSAQELASQMAEIARNIRDEIAELLGIETDKGPLRSLFEEVKRDLRSDLDHKSFADMYAQTMVYGLLAARVAHPENFAADAVVTALRFDNPFLDALYSSFRKRGEDVIDVDEFGLQDLVQTLSVTDVEALLANFGTEDLKDDPVVFFYQYFLDSYDPKQRKDLGTYYTPIPVVRFMVRAVDEIIKTEFKLPLGVADQTTWGEYSKTQKIAIPKGLTKNDKVIRMIDPATGTGTFLLEWMRQASSNLKAANQHTAKAMESVVQQMDAFELSLSSYAVAHLKTNLELDPSIRAKTLIGIRLTDTLAGRAPSQGNLFNDDPIAREGQLAEQVKFETKHSVVIGNPPYNRSDRKTAGGWIVHPSEGGRSLFDDILEPARENTIFSHLRSLSNIYIYFWRWAIWKAFEDLPAGPSVVAYITARSWLSGPGFMGLRDLARRTSQHIYVVDLGGDNNGARPEENVFDIQIPVAVVFLVRSQGASEEEAEAQVSYIRVNGQRTEKLEFLNSLNFNSAKWDSGPSGYLSSLAPITGGDAWGSMPRLADLFPWQQPGCIHARTWPVCPSTTTLRSRWSRLLSTTDLVKRAQWFVTAKTGRNINTSVHGLTRIADLKKGTEPRSFIRYAYRAFDRQFTFDDPRLAKTESPSLWAAVSERNVFLITGMTIPLGFGPAAVTTRDLPDFQHFRGSFGGKDVIPLYRDDKYEPNTDPKLIAAINGLLVESGKLPDEISHESLFAYCFGVLAGTDYTTRFRAELETPGPRIPLTHDSQLFRQMADFGSQLLWLQTFGERFRMAERKALKLDGKIKWSRKPTRIPDDSRDFSYDAEAEVLSIADGKLAGVSKSAWDFEVSGMHVIKKWLGYRTAKGAGRAASSDSPLDKIRPTEWEPEWSDELREIVHVLTETEKLRPKGVKLLEQIMEGELIKADELPQPPEELRKPPARVTGEGLFDEDESDAVDE
jgi:predicted helicase